MRQRWLILFLLLGAGLSLLAGCTTRTTVTPQSGAPVGPPAPTQGVAATAVPTAPPVAQDTPIPGTAAPEPTPPTALVAPQLTVMGTLASGVSWGTTSDGNFFKGDPNAPLIMFEFSDYQ
jgi:hypothetical protein